MKRKIKIFISTLIILLIYIISLLYSFSETSEKLNSIIIRVRKKFKFPFLKKRTYIIKDINTYNGETVTHIFSYMFNKAFQFINGKFSSILELDEVQ